MKKKKFNLKSSQIISDIQKIRSNNNKNWMNILRLAFKSNPKQASKILGKITSSDKKISKLTSKLQKLNN